MNTIYLNHENDHIKLVQTDMQTLVYIRSNDGKEWLCPSSYLCQLIRKAANINEWGNK